MNVSRLKLAFCLAALFYGIGLAVLAIWPFLQREVGSHFPSWIAPVTANLAYWGIFATVGGMVLGVLPPYHRFRIAGDFIGCGAFLLNLMVQKNSGNVALEVALVLLTGWSLWSNHAHHKPITATRQQLAKAIATIAACYLFGLTVAFMWPVDTQTQYQGWYWQYIAIGGALVIFGSLAALETRVVSGDQWQYALVYGIGCMLLTLSYLGQYSWAGLTLNSSLAALTYGPLMYKFIARQLTGQPPIEAAVHN
jgi:hypothetical protein